MFLYRILKESDSKNFYWIPCIKRSFPPPPFLIFFYFFFLSYTFRTVNELGMTWCLDREPKERILKYGFEKVAKRLRSDGGRWWKRPRAFFCFSNKPNFDWNRFPFFCQRVQRFIVALKFKQTNNIPTSFLLILFHIGFFTPKKLFVRWHIFSSMVHNYSLVSSHCLFILDYPFSNIELLLNYRTLSVITTLHNFAYQILWFLYINL